MVHRSWSAGWILLAAFTPLPASAQSSPAVNKPAVLADLWKDLLEPDAMKAFRAMRQLAQTPKETVAFLADKLAPVPTAKSDVLDSLIRKLSSERFAEREQARKELEGYDWQAWAALKKAGQGNLDLEGKRRVDQM